MNGAVADLPFALRNAWLVAAIPFISFAFVGLVLRPLAPRVAAVVATLAIFAAAAMAAAVAVAYFGLYPPGSEHPVLVPFAVEWLRYQAGFTVSMGALVDPISVLLIVVVTTISAFVHLYSLGYMHGDRGIGRFFTWLNLFTFSMLGLVLASNLLQIYIFWELVGVSSFLLIGYYYEKPSAVAASKKAFIVTRFADLGFLLGVLLLGFYGFNMFGEVGPGVADAVAGRIAGVLQPLDFLYLTDPAFLARMIDSGVTIAGVPLLTLAMILVFMGAAGKSAMFPLHIWLPDAMEGPTPVSALIHAATMVVAGVYLVARLFPAFAASGDALTVVAGVGAFTCLFAATIGCTQDDIKRVLAFSTLSQLGYMMFALGVAAMDRPAGYTASMFHLFTHAFFKALLFLGAGAVIHSVHSNSIWDMGGLRKRMPVTHLTFLVATLAIAGIWPFSGFFSKDEILAAALHGGHPIVFGIGLLVAGLTAFYMFRIYIMAFLGDARQEGASHAHEAPAVMLVTLVFLALASIGAGFVPFPSFVWLGGEAPHHGIDFAVAIPATSAGLLGIALAFLLYSKGAVRAKAGAAALGAVYRTIKQKFYIDEFYIFVTRRIIFNFVSRPIAWFDRHVVDGMVNLSGWITRWGGRILGRLHGGRVQAYGVWLVGGTLFLLLILWSAVR
jgi:NADH-quinone oxidoreductase subunit L